jgi:hypothetical protein
VTFVYKQWIMLVHMGSSNSITLSLVSLEHLYTVSHWPQYCVQIGYAREDVRRGSSSSHDPSGYTHRPHWDINGDCARNTESDKVTLKTTVQQIMTGLKTARTEDDRFALIMNAVFRNVMKK